MIAHQFKIREQKRKEEEGKLSFDYNKVSLDKSYIKQISRNEAKKIIEEYEWLGKLSSFNLYYFGLFFKIDSNDYLGGVVVYSNEYTLNTGVWNKYGFSDKIILLSRGVCLWWTPKNSASYFISQTLKWLKTNTKYRIVTATVDPEAGEIGTIYQSLNWYYVGLLSGNYSNSGKELVRYSILIDNKLRTSRSIRKELGSMKKEVVLAKYPNAIFIPKYRKRRYFYFFGNKNENKIYFKSIKKIIQPYPKRNNPEISGLIYMIKNTINGKIYIGQTTRPLLNRIQDYKNGLGNSYLNNSFNKYGFDKFEFTVIDTALTIDELNEKEIHWINYYNSQDKTIGYNLEYGGKNSKPSNETLLKMSESHKNIKQSKKWIEKRIAKAGSIDAKKYGKIKTNEEKKILSENSSKFWLGKQRDNETKNKISKTKKEQNLIPVNSKKVAKINAINNEIIEIYSSTTEAARQNSDFSQSTISRKCNGISLNTGSVHWKFID